MSQFEINIGVTVEADNVDDAMFEALHVSAPGLTVMTVDLVERHSAPEVSTLSTPPLAAQDGAGMRETMWATVIYEGEDNSFRFELNEEGNRDGVHYDRSIEFSAGTFPVGTKIVVYEPNDDGVEDQLNELDEIADGAWGDGPMMRGAARDEAARIRTTPPSQALNAGDGEAVYLGTPDPVAVAARLDAEAKKILKGGPIWGEGETVVVMREASHLLRASALTHPAAGRVVSDDRLVKAIDAFMPHAQVAFLWQTKGAKPGEVEAYRDAYWEVKKAIAASLSSLGGGE